MTITGTIIGYDPGGNGSHGVALARYVNGELISIEVETYNTANSVLDIMLSCADLMAIGVDTLTCWSTGESGWRPADRWLKEHYPITTNSVLSANSLSGSMGLNGMSVLIEARNQFPQVHISETHPKVLYHELSGKKYDYKHLNIEMDELVGNYLGTPIRTKNDHEWDALISIYAVYSGFSGYWQHDLHSIESSTSEKLVTPCGVSQYWWPK